MKKLTISKDFKGKVFFVSDTHFGHKNIIKYCVRPFKTVDEMDEHLIQKWNKVISENDIVIHCGDVAFGNKLKWEYYISQLNGQIHLVQGNHDREDSIPGNLFFESVSDILQVSIYDEELEGYATIICCHYCMQTWPGQWKGAMHVFGHSHSKQSDFPDSKHLINRNLPSYDVGVDNNNFTPVSYEDLKTIFTKQLLYGEEKRKE